MNLSLFLLAAPESLSVSTVWQALPLSEVSFVGGTKVKFLNTQSWVDNRFLSFSLFEEDFLFKAGIYSSPKFPNGFQGWSWKKNRSYCTEGVFPLSTPKTGDKIQQFFLKKQMPTLSRARTRLHQSGAYEQQHGAYTNNHTRLHTYSELLSSHQIFAAKLLYRSVICLLSERTFLSSL